MSDTHPRETAVADPQLRCLLCDLILADATTAGQPTERCKQCGRDVLAGQTAAGPSPIPLQPLGAKEPITVVEELPEATVVMDAVDATPVPAIPPVPAGDVPVVGAVKPPADVPTVQPRPRPQSWAIPPSMTRRGEPRSAASKPIPPLRKVNVPDPSGPVLDRPRPKIALALGVLGCMTLLIVVCLSVIAYAILTGLQKARKVEVPFSPRPAFSVPG